MICSHEIRIGFPFCRRRQPFSSYKRFTCRLVFFFFIIMLCITVRPWTPRHTLCISFTQNTPNGNLCARTIPKSKNRIPAIGKISEWTWKRIKKNAEMKRTQTNGNKSIHKVYTRALTIIMMTVESTKTRWPAQYMTRIKRDFVLLQVRNNILSVGRFVSDATNTMNWKHTSKWEKSWGKMSAGNGRAAPSADSLWIGISSNDPKFIEIFA